ncbi:MAG: hypothetical protein R3A46_08245 [Thermomicrobiales bacterium]
MAENTPPEPPAEPRDEERFPWQQVLFDDIFLLLMAGLVTPTLFYIVWGLWSLSNVRVFQP